MPYLMSTVLRPQIISRSLACNMLHQHKPSSQAFSVFNSWESLGSSDIICFSLTHRETSLRAGMLWSSKGTSQRPEQRYFPARHTLGYQHPVPWVTHSLRLLHRGAGGAGRQDSGSQPAATQRQSLTRSVSNLALPVGISLKGVIWP